MSLNNNWTEDTNLENGNYFHICGICNENFTGHKRRTPVCKSCSPHSQTCLSRLKARKDPADGLLICKTDGPCDCHHKDRIIEKKKVLSISVL
jgi:hypothetical protein